MEDYTEDIQNPFIIEEDAPTIDRELNDFNTLYHSNGWLRLLEYFESSKKALEYASKIKKPEESLESYGAKRMSADSLIEFIDNTINIVKNNAEAFNEKNK